MQLVSNVLLSSVNDTSISAQYLFTGQGDIRCAVVATVSVVTALTTVSVVTALTAVSIVTALTAVSVVTALTAVSVVTALTVVSIVTALTAVSIVTALTAVSVVLLPLRPCYSCYGRVRFVTIQVTTSANSDEQAAVILCMYRNEQMRF